MIQTVGSFACAEFLGITNENGELYFLIVNNCRPSYLLVFFVYMLSDMKRGIFYHCVFQVNFHYSSDPCYQPHSKL